MVIFYSLYCAHDSILKLCRVRVTILFLWPRLLNLKKKIYYEDFCYYIYFKSMVFKSEGVIFDRVIAQKKKKKKQTGPKFLSQSVSVCYILYQFVVVRLCD